jgi:hypothetical protein
LHSHKDRPAVVHFPQARTLLSAAMAPRRLSTRATRRASRERRCIGTEMMGTTQSSSSPQTSSTPRRPSRPGARSVYWPNPDGPECPVVCQLPELKRTRYSQSGSFHLLQELVIGNSRITALAAITVRLSGRRLMSERRASGLRQAGRWQEADRCGEDELYEEMCDR